MLPTKFIASSMSAQNLPRYSMWNFLWTHCFSHANKTI